MKRQALMIDWEIAQELKLYAVKNRITIKQIIEDYIKSLIKKTTSR